MRIYKVQYILKNLEKTSLQKSPHLLELSCLVYGASVAGLLESVQSHMTQRVGIKGHMDVHLLSVPPLI